MSNQRIRLIFAAMCSGLAKLTFAAGLTSFVAVGVGNTTAEVSNLGGQAATSGAGYRLIVGSQLTPGFSIETEYIDLGQFANSTANITAKGLGISGLLTMPMSGIISIYGRAGYARIETTLTPFAGIAAATQTDAIAGLTWGYGLEFDIAPNASIRLSWDRYKSSVLAGAFTDRIDMNSSGLLLYRF